MSNNTTPSLFYCFGLAVVCPGRGMLHLWVNVEVLLFADALQLNILRGNGQIYP